MNSENQRIIQTIKNIVWDKRVTRAGFLQSKQIVSEACISKIQLTKSVTVNYNNFLWVNDLNLYDELQTNLFSAEFAKAFNEDKHWPINVVEKLEKFAIDVNNLILKLNSDLTGEEKIDTFSKYVELLKLVQKYYIIAVPLTNYCENEIKQKNLISVYATPFKPLEIDEIQTSLEKIKTEADIKNHIEKYGWIKTSYNIIQEYTVEDVKEEIKYSHKKQETKKPEVPVEERHYFEGLQIGIYLRNRMKELSQKLWFHVRELGKSIAKELNISQEEFFQLRYFEVIASYKKRECIVDKENLKKRQIGFITGFLDNKEILIVGEEAIKLFDYYNKAVQDTGGLKGRVACQGFVKGKAKLILNLNHFKDFLKGEILVTKMTSPDFLPIMKKAAAIITDEGGLSCHAAIVSRELGIPCVVGTEYATKALKNGDLVEVDANKGVIRKL